MLLRGFLFLTPVVRDVRMANAKIIVFVLFILFDVCFDIVCYYAFCIANILFFLIEIHALQLPVVSKHEKSAKMLF